MSTGMTLRAWLTASSRGSGQERRNMLALLRQPWCWPADVKLQEVALAAGAKLPRSPLPGEVLLLSVTTEATPRAGLWLLARDARSGRVPFLDEAASSLLRARRLVTQGLPYLTSLLTVSDRVTWLGAPLAGEGARLREQQTLHGTSFGLSLALGLGSAVMGVPLPTDLAASAALGADGSLTRVNSAGLKAKIELLRDWAPGVTRLFAAHEQEQEAKELVKRLGAPLDVKGIKSLGEALWREVFREAAPTPWTSETATSASDDLFALALDPQTQLHDWSAVERAAELLLPWASGDRTLSDDLVLAREVARRHHRNGGDPVLIERLFARPARGNQRFRRLAHRLQHLSDSNDPADGTPLVQRVDELSAIVTPIAESDEYGLELHGALGRAEILLGRWKPAEERLRATIGGWRSLPAFHQASRSVAALARVSGLLREQAGLVKAESLYAELERSGNTRRVDLAFARLDFGRGHMLAEAPAEAVRWLSDEGFNWPESGAPDWAQHSRLRWLALALRALGRHAEADEYRTKVLARQPTDFVSWLVRLDQALEGQATAQELLGLLDELERAQSLTARFRSPQAPREQAQRVVREFPY